MNTPARERERDLERFLTFVDAVVAIAITLLVLPLVDLATEVAGGGSVAGLLADHQPQLWGFVLSFAVIANLWFTQHRIMRTVVAQDPWVTRLLTVWLFTIVVLPFPTALVAEEGSQAATKILYIGTMALSAASLAAIAYRVTRVPEVRDSDDAPSPGSAVASAALLLLALAITLLFPATGYWPLLLLLSDNAVARIRRVRRGG